MNLNCRKSNSKKTLLEVFTEFQNPGSGFLNNKFLNQNAGCNSVAFWEGHGRVLNYRRKQKHRSLGKAPRRAVWHLPRRRPSAAAWEWPAGASGSFPSAFRASLGIFISIFSIEDTIGHRPWIRSTIGRPSRRPSRWPSRWSSSRPSSRLTRRPSIVGRPDGRPDGLR